MPREFPREHPKTSRFVERVAGQAERAQRLGWRLDTLPPQYAGDRAELLLVDGDGRTIARGFYLTVIEAAIAGGEALRDRARAELGRMPGRPAPDAATPSESAKGGPR